MTVVSYAILIIPFSLIEACDGLFYFFDLIGVWRQFCTYDCMC